MSKIKVDSDIVMQTFLSRKDNIKQLKWLEVRTNCLWFLLGLLVGGVIGYLVR